MLAHLLQHIKMESSAHVQREMLHMLLRHALPDAHEILGRLAMGHDGAGKLYTINIFSKIDAQQNVMMDCSMVPSIFCLTYIFIGLYNFVKWNIGQSKIKS